MARIPVFPRTRVFAWPKHEKAKRWPYQFVAEAMQAQHPSDAHFAAYSAEAQPFRLALDAFGTISGGVAMVLAVFDVDAPQHGAGGTDDWWLVELPKVMRLLEAHSGGFVYRTRGGYRIVYELRDVVVRDRADLAAWKLRYCAWVAYLRRAFGIAGDYACKDATRLFRFPFVVRDGQAERRETIGDVASLGAWSCLASPEDEAVAARFVRARVAKTKRAEDRAAPALITGEGVLFHAFRARGEIGRDLGGKHTIRCPWSSEHSGGADHDSSTVLFAPGAGETFGYPHCSHGHCAHRTLADWVSVLSAAELATARVAAGLSAEPEPPAPEVLDDAPRDVPTIEIRTDEHRVNDEAIAALGRIDGLYQRGGSLSEIVDNDGRRLIRAIPLPRVRELVASAARFIVFRQNEMTGEMEEKPAFVPDWCTRAVASRGVWPGIPPLRGIIDAPALRPDGSVIQGLGGYDSASGFLYMPAHAYPPIAESPSQRDAMHGARALLEVVRDFPFASDTHRAAWLAAVLTLFARPAFAGPSPLVAIDANVRGSGKGKLTDTIAVLATGRAASKTPQPKDDDEMRKRITSVLREGERIEVIDNVSRPIDDGAFDALLTSDVWKDRALGKNETIALPNLALWVVTGNNLAFGADTARRTLHVRLSSPHENPENRDDFEQRDLLGHVAAHRPRLVAAALTILRAYFAAGRPDMGVRPWGSFETWSALVASAVVFAGMPDPQTTRTELEATADTSKSKLVALLEGWARLTREMPDGITAKNAIEALYPQERLRGLATYDDGHNGLREAIEGLVATLTGKAPSPTKLGYQLRHFRGRVVRGRCFDGAEDRNGVIRWRVTRTETTAGDAGDRGDVLVDPTCGKLKLSCNGSATGVGLKNDPHGPHHPHLETVQ